MPTHSSMATIHELDWLRTLAGRLACEDQDDLVQDTVLTAWKNPPQVGPDRPLRPWLATVARNRVRLDARARRRREQRERDSVDVISPSAAAQPDDELQRVLVLQALSAALDELDELDRRIIVRRFFDEENATQIGQRLGIPASTVRSRLRRALAQLRASLDRRHGGRREVWALALIGPAPRAKATAGSIGFGAKLGITLTLGAVGALSWSSCDRESNGGEAEQAAVVAVEPAPSEREIREQRRARIHAAQTERKSASEPEAEADPEAIRQAQRDAMAHARAGFSELERACMEDLETDKSGAITLSAVVIGEPGLGTIFDAVEIAADTVSDPEVIACLRESMYAYVGDPPPLPVESLFVTTMQWAGRDDDEARKQRRMFDAIVGAHHSEVAACQRNEGFAGTGAAVLEIAIGEDRRPAEARVVSSNLPEAVVECIVDASLRWAFPADLVDRVYRYEFELPVAGLERIFGE